MESQLPTSENNYTCYRKYKSGWVEQGGLVNDITGNPGTVNLIIEMSFSYYIRLCIVNRG